MLHFLFIHLSTLSVWSSPRIGNSCPCAHAYHGGMNWRPIGDGFFAPLQVPISHWGALEGEFLASYWSWQRATCILHWRRWRRSHRNCSRSKPKKLPQFSPLLHNTLTCTHQECRRGLNWLNSCEYGIQISRRLCRGSTINITGALAEYRLREDEQNAKAGSGDEVLVKEVRSLKEIVSEL